MQKKNTQDDFIETYSYRGVDAKIYIDDCCQCYYAVIFDETYPFGTYTPLNICYDEIKYLVDEKLDVIYRFNYAPYYGACIRYEKDETRSISLYYRLEKMYTLPEGLVYDDQIKWCTDKLDELFDSAEFQRAEKERLENRDLFLYEIMKEEDK